MPGIIGAWTRGGGEVIIDFDAKTVTVGGKVLAIPAHCDNVPLYPCMVGYDEETYEVLANAVADIGWCPDGDERCASVREAATGDTPALAAGRNGALGVVQTFVQAAKDRAAKELVLRLVLHSG